MKNGLVGCITVFVLAAVVVGLLGMVLDFFIVNIGAVIVVCLVVVGAIVAVYYSDKKKDIQNYAAVEQEVIRVRNAEYLEPIKASVALSSNDKVYFERTGVSLMPEKDVRKRSTGTLLLTDTRCLFFSKEFISLPYEEFGAANISSHFGKKSQAMLEFASLQDSDKFDFVVPLANEELLRIYLGKIMSGYKESRIIGQLELPKDNVCPRCRATLVEGRCKYCRWTPAGL